MDLTKDKCKCAPSSKILLQNLLRNSKQITNDLLITRKCVSCPSDSVWVPVWYSSPPIQFLWFGCRLSRRVVSIWQQDKNDELSPEWEGVN